ncbi:hypothetical protein NDU88_001268 [Pleurodeles waltl]|uniref:Uncharacterized protein n=1 Tax=Pleurodeles waltl TaxID=8319 RepID=A0AAV7SBV2_PLEWA|nr:hypothetical protein NDU88_001268 [Pleurodeles waltl]
MYLTQRSPQGRANHQAAASPPDDAHFPRIRFPSNESIRVHQRSTSGAKQEGPARASLEAPEEVNDPIAESSAT